jgi:hypothetical protein
MYHADVERLVARGLRRLPAPRAPQTLLPRVLAAVQAWSRRPWYAREWFTWPLVWQVISIALLLLIVVGGTALLPVLQTFIRGTASTLTSAVLSGLPNLAPGLPDVARGAEVTANTARVLWRALIEPFLLYAFVLVGLMCLACATFAVALNRAVFGRALHS